MDGHVRRGLESSELLFLLGMSFQQTLEKFVARMDAAGYQELRPIHGLVFQSLLAGATTSSEIAAALGVTKQAAGQILNDLDAAGYVVRTEHPDGGRRRLVSLTGKGHQHLRTSGGLLAELEREIGDALPEGGLPALRGLLALVIEHFADGRLPPFRPSWH